MRTSTATTRSPSTSTSSRWTCRPTRRGTSTTPRPPGTARRPWSRSTARSCASARDGSRTDILATGFRAPNGVCLNPDGTFFLDRPGGFLDCRRTGSTTSSPRRLLRQHVGLPRRDRPVRLRDGAARLLDHQRLRPLARRAGPGRLGRRWGPLEGIAAEPVLRHGQGLRRPPRDRRRRDAGGRLRAADAHRSRPA